KTLFWVLLAVILVLFASRNWSDATINLWGDIQVDIKLPVLILVVFMLGFLPIFLVHRTRLWTLKRHLEVEQRHQAIAGQPSPLDNAASTV
ncbi:MAG: hypothetical protein ABIN68_04045, partial [Sphingomicrobium sp.]